MFSPICGGETEPSLKTQTDGRVRPRTSLECTRESCPARSPRRLETLAPGPARRSDVREEQSLQPKSYQQRVGFAFLTRACPTGCEEDEEPEKGPAVVGDPMFRKEGGEDTHFWLKTTAASVVFAKDGRKVASF